MKKRALLILCMVFLLSFVGILSAVEDCGDDEACKIGNATTCLIDKVGNCSSPHLSHLDKVFSSLSVGKCTQEILDKPTEGDTCWPKLPAGSCDLKTTAQTVLALYEAENSTSNATSWLLSNNLTYDGLTWYLQIDSNDATQCTINYTEGLYTINIGENKKINAGAGNCLKLAQDNNWLEISSDCYDREFSISCDKSFLTSKLYRKKNSGDDATLYISRHTNTASEGGKVKEKVNSSCLGKDGQCDYEGTLWATLVLGITENNISQFIPYLIIESEKSENSQYLPEAFLYLIRGETGIEHKIDLLLKQTKINRRQYYWDVSGDKYYDTALALLPFKGTGRNNNLEEKINTKKWLLSEDVQNSNGCWNNGNIADTGFILYSAFNVGGRGGDDTGGDDTGSDDTGSDDTGGDDTGSDDTGGDDTGGDDTGGDDTGSDDTGGDDSSECEEAGYSCTSGIDCTNLGGAIYRQYSCGGFGEECCSKNIAERSCSDLNGQICISSEECSGTSQSASDLRSGQKCCVGGSCRSPGTTDGGDDGDGSGDGGEDAECESEGGTCSLECRSDEKRISYSCSQINEVCCKKKGESNNIILIIVLFVLILLTVLGIIFREKLKLLLDKIKNRKNEEGFPPPGAGPFPGVPPGGPPPGMMPNGRPLPMAGRPLPGQGPDSEMDDVLTKLKNMGE